MPEFNLIFNSVSEGLIIIDNKGSINKINQILCRLLGVQESEMQGKNLYDILSECEGYTANKALPLLLIETLETHREHKRQELVYIKDKEALHLALSTYILRNNSRNITGILGIIYDITQKNKLEQQLWNIEKLAEVGQMAAELAHEIKNPICSIKGLLQIMGKKYNIDYSKYYEIIMSEIDRVTALLQDFLSLTQAGLVFEKTNIRDVIEDIVPLVESQLISKNITISIDIDKQLPQIYCDRENIRRVLVNIIQNAVEASQNNGRIIINAWYDEINEKLKVECKDNGIGIKPEYLEKIFEPFFTTKNNGSGLGLAISRKIIEKHRGRLYAFNNRDGGATFVIELPLSS